MDPNVLDPDEPTGLDRRSLLKKAAVGGAVVFATPIITSTPAWAMFSDCRPTASLDNFAITFFGVGGSGATVDNWDTVGLEVTGRATCVGSGNCDPTDITGDFPGAIIKSIEWSFGTGGTFTSGNAFFARSTSYDTSQLITLQNWFSRQTPPVQGSTWTGTTNNPGFDDPFPAPPLSPAEKANRVVIISTNGTQENPTSTGGVTATININVKLKVACLDANNVEVPNSEQCFLLQGRDGLFNDNNNLPAFGPAAFDSTTVTVVPC